MRRRVVAVVILILVMLFLCLACTLFTYSVSDKGAQAGVLISMAHTLHTINADQTHVEALYTQAEQLFAAAMKERPCDTNILLPYANAYVVSRPDVGGTQQDGINAGEINVWRDATDHACKDNWPVWQGYAEWVSQYEGKDKAAAIVVTFGETHPDYSVQMDFWFAKHQ